VNEAEVTEAAVESSSQSGPEEAKLFFRFWRARAKGALRSALARLRLVAKKILQNDTVARFVVI
jgi:hypothetical protein